MLCAKLNLFQKVHAVLAGTDMYSDLINIAHKYSDYHRLSNSFTGVIDSIREAIESLDENEVIQNVMKVVSPIASVSEDA
jgi:alpha-amylase/alpha-mannosidase (GH57 family)